MKVVHTSHHSVFAYRFIVPMVERLLEKNVDVELWLDPPENKELVNSFKIPKRKIRDNFSVNPFVFVFRLLNYVFHLKKHSPQVIHCHTTLCSVIPLLAARIARVPIRIYHNHGFPFLGYNGILKVILLFIEKLNISNSTAFFTVSHSNKNEFLKYHHMVPNELIVFGGGSAIGLNKKNHPEEYSEPNFKKKMRTHFKLNQDDFIVGLVGRPHHRKGFHFMVDVWERYQMHEKNSFLAIAGCSNEDLINAFPNRKLKGVKAMGFIPNIDDFISALDVLVLPSNHEGFGNTMIEAGARFRPAIGSDIPGIQCTIKNGETGFLFKKYNFDDFYKKILFLLENPQKAEEMGRAGREDVMSRFTEDEVLGGIIRYYEKNFPNLFP